MKQYSFLEEAEKMPDYTKFEKIDVENNNGLPDFTQVTDISKTNSELPDFTRAKEITIKENK